MESRQPITFLLQQRQPVGWLKVFLTGSCSCLCFQRELERVEEEQTLEELHSLREVVHDWFRKQEQMAEVPLRPPPYT